MYYIDKKTGLRIIYSEGNLQDSIPKKAIHWLHKNMESKEFAALQGMPREEIELHPGEPYYMVIMNFSWFETEEGEDYWSHIYWKLQETYRQEQINA